jgi:hypothetical protein
MKWVMPILPPAFQLKIFDIFAEVVNVLLVLSPLPELFPLPVPTRASTCVKKRVDPGEELKK